MDEYTYIKVYESIQDTKVSLGIIRMKGELTYKKARVEIIDDEIFQDPFCFVIDKDCILSVQQEGKWTIDSKSVYVRSSVIHPSQLSSEGSCTGVVEPREEQCSPHAEFVRNVKEEELLMVPKDIAAEWEKECKRIRLKLSDMVIPRDDKFEIRVDCFKGKALIRLWCHECGELYGSGSYEGRSAAKSCLSNFFRSHISSQYHEKRYGIRRGLIKDQIISPKRVKLDDAAVIASSLEVMKQYNTVNNNAHFELVESTLNDYKDKSLVKIRCIFDDSWFSLCPARSDLVAILNQHVFNTKTHAKAVRNMEKQRMLGTTNLHSSQRAEK